MAPCLPKRQWHGGSMFLGPAQTRPTLGQDPGMGKGSPVPWSPQPGSRMAFSKAQAPGITQQHPPHRFHKPSSVSPYKSNLHKPSCHQLFPNLAQASLLPTTFKQCLVMRWELESGRRRAPYHLYHLPVFPSGKPGSKSTGEPANSPHLPTKPR